MRTDYDVIIVGGGHAGAEAAWAAGRLGAHTALITMQYEAIGRLSCNPAIGGIGKGQMVREIDALGGLMGLAADQAGIQFRMLNRRKGPAVWAPRAQADRDLYPAAVQRLLAETAGLEIIEGIVERIVFEDVSEAAPSAPLKRITGVVLQDGRRFSADTLILTTGTFLRGLMHRGTEQCEGGRVGEPAANGLSRSLNDMGITLGRLKTGTPPRVDRNTVDYDACEIQAGDDPPVPFSFLTDTLSQPQIHCWITYTNEAAHRHIRDNLHLAPMYSGQIQSRGPRYCPSIEDKIVRFADKTRHQIFLEPEGYHCERIYCNGISTSLPAAVQQAMIECIPGLTRARMVQPGYAVEYDFVPTTQTTVGLHSKRVQGLFFAGQINGTSGYEEAAAQGLVAGINAVRFLRGQEPFTLSRHEAYIGVMIDDLITRPPSEPYRMFTSRAEYRLRLRADNADQRLTPLGRDLGLVDDRRWSRFVARTAALERIAGAAQKLRLDNQPAREWMRRPDASVETLLQALAGDAALDDIHPEHVWQVLTDAKYSGYEARQQRQIERFRRLEDMPIPVGLDFLRISELRAEAREQLSNVGPRTLGQAARISGINPADITTLWIYLRGRRRRPEPLSPDNRPDAPAAPRTDAAPEHPTAMAAKKSAL